MVAKIKELKNGTRQILTHFLSKTAPALFLSSLLFIGGIILLALKIPGWSIFFGLPATQLGIIFLIFTFDEIARTKVGPDGLHLIPCSICGKPIIAPLGKEEDICEDCQAKIKKKLKKEL